MHAMRSTQGRIITSIVVFAVALTGALFLLNARANDTDDGGGKGPGSTAAATSDVWSVGDSWTVTVNQDAGAITPDGAESIAQVPYRFEVDDAPVDASGYWRVHVTQDGAEGPFAKGWYLHYKDTDGVMVLKQVAVGSEPPLEAELASIVLGPQFPYEVRYEARPTDSTVDADTLLDRSALPPGELPDGGTDGAAPPAQAPAPDLDEAPPVDAG